jgi:DNA replication protein DnaC
MSELLVREHALGLHALYAPPGCDECPTVERMEIQVPVELPRDAIRHVNGFTSLGEAIADIRRHRGRLFSDGKPPDPEPPEAADGNPWCDICRGGRQLADRSDPRVTTYVDCPGCKRAPWRIAKQYERLKLSIPARFQPCRLSTFPTTHPKQREVLAKLHAWLEDPEPSWLFMFGPTGRGKTGLAVALLYALADRGLSPAFSIITDLLTTIKATYGAPDGESESSILDVLYGGDIFVLDDLGSEYHRSSEDWTSEKIFQLIAGRHAALKRTIITSNLPLEQLERKLGHPRTIRRIVEATTPRWMIDFSRLPLIGDLRDADSP